jgi:hypothetical protein
MEKMSYCVRRAFEHVISKSKSPSNQLNKRLQNMYQQAREDTRINTEWDKTSRLLNLTNRNKEK